MAEVIERVSEEQLQHFIDLWADDAKNRACLRKVRWYAEHKDGTATAVDNTTDNCWTESFINKEEAVKWLESPSLAAVDGRAVEEE